MAGFDFGKIGKVISQFMDSDYIDIKRDSSGSLMELYSNVPCHISYASTDNPDPLTVDTKPIIQSITVHCNLFVDIQNNDFIIAKKTGSDGSLIATYSGRCGNPVVSQGRKKVLMQMNGTSPENPSPLPPQKPAKITVQYFSDGNPIQDTAILEAEIGDSFDLQAPIIEGYKIAECYVDDVLQESTAVHIENVSENGYDVRFVYAVSDTPEFFRFLVKGLYTKDDGSLANGYHLYYKVNIDLVSENEGVYTITSDDVKLTHAESGKTLSIKAGAKIVLIPSNTFAEITEIVLVENGKVVFTATAYEPTSAEQNAYVCGWYD